MNLCINCIYFVRSETTHVEHSKCAYNRPKSLVSGELVPVESLPFCQLERRDTGRCGIAGDNFDLDMTEEEELAWKIMGGKPNE
jgi:hypothetical protein